MTYLIAVIQSTQGVLVVLRLFGVDLFEDLRRLRQALRANERQRFQDLERFV